GYPGVHASAGGGLSTEHRNRGSAREDDGPRALRRRPRSPYYETLSGASSGIVAQPGGSRRLRVSAGQLRAGYPQRNRSARDRAFDRASSGDGSRRGGRNRPLAAEITGAVCGLPGGPGMGFQRAIAALSQYFG